MSTRSTPSLSFAAAVGSFALGAACTWAAHEAMQRMRARPPSVSDDVVLERVRARVAEIVSRPGSIDIGVENGVVRLAGDVTAEERDQLLSQLLWLPGVVRLRNALGTS